MTDMTCCWTIKKLREEGWDLPFEDSFMLIPTSEEGDDFDFACKTVITLMRRTPKGNISSKTSGVFMNYCPFCGKDLREEETSDA